MTPEKIKEITDKVKTPCLVGAVFFDRTLQQNVCLVNSDKCQCKQAYEKALSEAGVPVVNKETQFAPLFKETSPVIDRLCVSLNRAVEFYCAVMNPHINVTVTKIDPSAIVDGFLFIEVEAKSGRDLYLLGEHAAFLNHNSILLRQHVTKEWLEKSKAPI